MRTKSFAKLQKISGLKPLAEADRSEIIRMLKAHRLIEAIKLHRDATGSGLKEAKDAVEAISKQEGLERPKAIQIQTNNLLIVLIALLGTIAVLWAILRAF